MIAPSIVKVGTLAKAAGIIGLKQTDAYSLSTDFEGVRLPLHAIVHGKPEGEGLVIKANARARLISIPLAPIRNTLLISFNPALLKTALVSCPSIVGRKDLAEGISLGILALSATDLSELEWIFEVRAIS